MKIIVLNEVSTPVEGTRSRLCFQRITTAQDESTYFRTMWRCEKGKMRPLRGGAWEPSIEIGEKLRKEAKKAGWGG
jgi:hypothetical protein